MNIATKIEGTTISVTYELNEKELAILNHVKTNGYIEFRKKNPDDEGEMDDSRQFNELECEDLIHNNLLIYDYDAWHRTYKLTDLAKQILA